MSSGNESSHHHISDDISKDIEEGLKKAQQVAKIVFGDRARNRDVYVIYEFMMGALHCEHEEEKKEPWE